MMMQFSVIIDGEDDPVTIQIDFEESADRNSRAVAREIAEKGFFYVDPQGDDIFIPAHRVRAVRIHHVDGAGTGSV